MLTNRVLNVAGHEADCAVEPSVSPAAFARPQDPPDQREHALWAGSADALGTLGLRPGGGVRADCLKAAIAGRHVHRRMRVRTDRDAYDLAFRAPDSVSWVWAQGNSVLRADLERSVLAAAGQCVDHLVRTRPLVGGVEPGRDTPPR